MKNQRCTLVFALAAAATLLIPAIATGEVVTLTPVADTSLFEKVPDNNLGSSQSLAVGNTVTPDPTRGLVRFDLQGAVPAGSRIQSATLDLKVVRASGLVEPATFELHRLLVDWGEGDKGSGSVTGTGVEAGSGETTWNSRFHGQTVWSTPGGAAGTDFASELSASDNVPAGEDLSFSGSNLTADVQRWLDDPGANFGWLLKDQFESSATTARRLGTREHPTSPPSLQIQFEAPLRIHRSVIKDGKFCLSFMAQGRAYLIESRDAVDSGDWRTVWVLPAADVPMEVEICDPAPVTGARFYRVREM